MVYAPVKEMDALHTATLDHTTQRVRANVSARPVLFLARTVLCLQALEGESVALKVSSACDIDLTFDMPTTATKITVHALACSACVG